LWTSLFMSTHTPEQNVRFGDPHESWHRPFVQLAPAGHAWPHDPQFCGSLWVFWHDPEPAELAFEGLHPDAGSAASAKANNEVRIQDRARLCGDFDMTGASRASRVPEAGRARTRMGSRSHAPNASVSSAESVGAGRNTRGPRSCRPCSARRTQAGARVYVANGGLEAPRKRTRVEVARRTHAHDEPLFSSDLVCAKPARAARAN
jgi:hypothetical protein